MALATYKVVTPKGVVISDGGLNIFYPQDSTFQASPINASVQSLLSLGYIRVVRQVEPEPPSPEPLVLLAPGAGPVGPVGPVGPPGPVGASTAHKLATTGADITIDTAAPPTTGQVLTATSAVAANWQTPIAGNDGLPVTVIAKTSNYTLLSTDAQKIFTNNGAVAQVNFTLPTWSIGLSYMIVVLAAQTVQIVAPGSDLIRLSTLISSGGGNFSTGVVGSSVRLVAVASGLWVATSITGSWTPA